MIVWVDIVKQFIRLLADLYGFGIVPAPQRDPPRHLSTVNRGSFAFIDAHKGFDQDVQEFV